MEKKSNNWLKGKQVVASFLLATSIMLSVTPVVHAESSQPATQVDEVTQSSTEELVGPNIIRNEGHNRENVAERVAEVHFSESNKVIIVNREKFPDAISATNISQGKYPVLYTREGSVSDSTLKLLKSMSLDEIYVLGGTLSVNESVVKQLQKETKVKVTRVAGRSRYDANTNAIEKNFTKANNVVIASGEVYSDALYGVSYANTVDSPVVLTNTNRLESSTVDLLKDLGVEHATIIGGPLTVTKEVENQLSKLGIEHSRIAGRNRYIGSAEVATASYKDPENVVVASGEVFSDALVSAPLAQKLEAPILLVRNNRMENVVESYLTNNGLDMENVYIQGGPLTILPAIENRIEDITKYLIKSSVLPFETIEEEDDTLLMGETKVAQIGENGFEKIFYNVTFNKGEEVSRKEFHRETLDPVPEIIKIGNRIDVESITLTPTDLILEEEESHQLIANILPENATNKHLTWSSSDEKIVTVDENGVIFAHNAGEVIIKASDKTGKVTDQLVITVKEPTIESIEDLTVNVTQYESFKFPTTVIATMSNNTTREVPISWESNEIDTSVIETYSIEGLVKGYKNPVKLNIIIEKYDPQLQVNAYSNITTNGLSKRLSLTINNNGTKSAHINKIEIYEKGKLITTYTDQELNNSAIETVIQPRESWGMSISYKLGIWLDNSYVKYYVSANNTNYEYEVYLK